jgi:hypothetical protein
MDEPGGQPWMRSCAGAFVHETYQCSLAGVAYLRHGSKFQLKGIVHEYTYVLRHNTNPREVLKRGWASLNPNPRAVSVDIKFTHGPGIQVKDTISPAGARQTAQRCYNRQVFGTPETVEEVAKYGKKIKSSGISSAHNEGAAARVGCPISWRSVSYNARAGAAIGAVVGVTVAVARGFWRYHKNDATWEEVVSDVAKEGFVGGVAGGAGAAAGTLAATGAATLVAAPLGVLAVSFLAGTVPSIAASKGANYVAGKAAGYDWGGFQELIVPVYEDGDGADLPREGAGELLPWEETVGYEPVLAVTF